jgi:hypothetical protein
MPELTPPSRLPTEGSTEHLPTADVSPVDYGTGKVDPFEKLFKMSTTAGLGSGDYVAVNGTAIAAVLLGIASALVLFKSPVLLMIPLVGIVCAVIAFVQISRSNGTQTGREAAAVGLLLSLGLGGFMGFQSFQTYMRNASDTKRLATLIERIGRDVTAGDPTSMADAYSQCDAAFAKRVRPDFFTARWQANHHSPMFGDLTSMESTGIFNFDDDQVSGDRLADTQVKVNFTRTGNQPARMRMVFRYVGDRWKVDQIELFPPEKPDDKKATQGTPPMQIKQEPLGPMGPPLPMTPATKPAA